MSCHFWRPACRMTQRVLNDVPDSRLGLLSKRRPTPFRPENEPTGSRPKVKQSKHVSFADAVAQLCGSSCALACPGNAQSKSKRRFVREPGRCPTSWPIRLRREQCVRRGRAHAHAVVPHHEIQQDGQGSDSVAGIPGPPFGDVRH